LWTGALVYLFSLSIFWDQIVPETFVMSEKDGERFCWESDLKLAFPVCVAVCLGGNESCAKPFAGTGRKSALIRHLSHERGCRGKRCV